MKMNVKIDGQTFTVEIADLRARPIQVTVDGEVFEVWVEADGAVSAALPLPADRAAAPGPVPVSTASAPAASAPAASAPAASAPAASAPAASAPAAPARAAQSNAVLAPIPGVIESISVKEGDRVVFGQTLYVLEAMKMKNLIKANRPGTVAAVRVKAGDQVRHGQVLLEYSE